MDQVEWLGFIYKNGHLYHSEASKRDLQATFDTYEQSNTIENYIKLAGKVSWMASISIYRRSLASILMAFVPQSYL